MRVQMVLSGVGGQGVLFATRLLAETAMTLGYEVIVSETYGMSQRGGSVVSHVKMGDFASSLVRPGAADYLVSFEAQEAYRYLRFVRPANHGRAGGIIYVNSGQAVSTPVQEYLDRQGISFRAVNATEIAGQLQAPLAANLILLGFACQDEAFPFRLGQLIATVEQISPAKAKEVNVRALVAASK